MKRKYKNQRALTAAIVLALTLGMPGGVYAADPISFDDGQQHTVDLSNHAVENENYAVRAENEGTVIQAPGEVNVSLTKQWDDTYGYAVDADNDSRISLGSENTKTISITANAQGNSDSYMRAIYSDNNSQVSLNGQTVNITATATASGDGNARGIYSDDDGYVTLNGQTVNITATANGDNEARGIYSDDDSYVTLNGQTVNIVATANGDDWAHGVDANDDSQVIIEGNDIIVSASSQGVARGIDPDDGGSVTLNGGNLTIQADAKSTAYGIDADGGTLTAVGQNMTIAATSAEDNATGIYADDGSQVTLDGQNVTITATAKDYASGIEAFDDKSNVTINAQNTTIDVTSDNIGAGMDVYDGAKVTVHNNLRLNTKAADPYQTIAVIAEDGGQVDINPEKTGTVVMKGNIAADNQQDTAVNVNLTGKDSSWTGNVIGINNSSNLNLYVADGASWTADGTQLFKMLQVPDDLPEEQKQELQEAINARYRANGLRNLSVVNNGKVQVGGTLTIGGTLQQEETEEQEEGFQPAPLGGTALVDGTSSLTADNIVINDKAELTVEDGANFMVNGMLSSAPEATVTLSNLSVGPKDTELLGVTHYNLGNNDWNNPKTLHALDLTVDPSNMEITNATGLQAGMSVRKLVLANSFADKEQPVNDDGTIPVVANGPVANGSAANGTVANNSSAQLTKLTNNSKKNLTFGTTLQGTGEAELEGNDVYYKVDVSGNAQPQTHSAVMGQVAGLTTVANGFDYINKAVDNGMEERGFNVFAAVGGGENKYDTGSHIKTNDWHAVAGVGVKNERDNGSSTTYGIFYDYGNGRYRTFQDAGYGSGKAIYRGGGLFGKYTAPSKFYVEGSFRAGRVENSANGIFHDYFGNRYSLKTDSDYNAFHMGVGKIYRLNDNDNLDVYGKFFHTHVSGDSFNAGGHYDIDGVDSDILRVGTRWNHKQGDWNHYLGLAYEYEFDGEAKGTADGARIRSADIGGSSVRFELGTNVETGKWVLGASASAYAGQHQGFGGNITAAYKF